MKPRIILSLLFLSFIASAFGQTNSVIDSLEDIIRTTKSDTVKVNCLLALSSAYFNINNPEKSFQSDKTALQLALAVNYKKGMATSYENLGWAYEKKGNYPVALKHYLAALNTLEEIGDIYGAGRIYNEIGKIYLKQAKYTEALENLSASLKIAEEIGDKFVTAHMYNSIGIIYAKQGNYAGASEYFFTALDIFKEIQDKWSIADAYNNIGSIHEEQGNYAKALENYIESLKIREEIGHKGRIASSYNNIGNIYKIQKEYTKALEHYLTALKLKEEVGGGNKINLANIYHNTGNTYQKLGNYEEALKNHSTALDIREEIDDWKGISSSYISIGSIKEHQGNYAEALENYSASLKISKEIQDKAGIVISYRFIGNIYKKQGNYPDARKYYDEGLALAKEIGNKQQVKESYYSLSSLDSVESNFAQALEHYKMYTRYKDSLFNAKSDQQISRLRIQYETEKKDREIALLNKDNEIKALQLDRHKASLLASRLETERNQSELLLKHDSIEIQQLKLAKAEKDLEHQKAEVDKNKAEVDLLNTEKALQEQRLQKQKILQNAMIAGTALLLLVGFLLFRSFRLRKKLEKQQAILDERKRISADLHDDIGSGLSRIMLLGELVKKEAKIPEARKDAEKISTISQELSANISEIIWALNTNNDYVENTVAYIRRYAANYFEDTPIKLKINTPDNIAHMPIKSEKRRNVFYAVKEALHNIVKHAKATEAELNFVVKNSALSVVIRDNGIGIPEGEPNRFGNGLNNMRHRMTSINGDMHIENGQGTRIILTLPV